MFESVEAPKVEGRKVRTKRIKPMGIRMEKLQAMLDAELVMTTAFEKLSDKEKKIYKATDKKEIAMRNASHNRHAAVLNNMNFSNNHPDVNINGTEFKHPKSLSTGFIHDNMTRNGYKPHTSYNFKDHRSGLDEESHTYSHPKSKSGITFKGSKGKMHTAEISRLY